MRTPFATCISSWSIYFLKQYFNKMCFLLYEYTQLKIKIAKTCMTVYRLMKYMDHGIIPQIANKMEKKIRHEVIYISVIEFLDVSFI
jgi:hypothetical protein